MTVFVLAALLAQPVLPSRPIAQGVKLESWQMAGYDSGSLAFRLREAAWSQGGSNHSYRREQRASSADVIIAQPAEHSDPLTHVLIGAFVTASALDLATSTYAFGRGTGYELNPLLRPLQQQPLAFGLAKGVTAASVAWLLQHVHRSHQWVVRVVAATLTGTLTAVAISNDRQARKR